MVAQGTDAHQLHLTLEEIDEHRQLVQPALTHESAEGADADVVGNLAAFAQTLLVEHIALQIFRIGVHRPHLIDLDLLAPLAYRERMPTFSSHNAN